MRLSRLRRASESALTREGLVTTFPETQAPDELGDVARSFSTLLRRLNEYTGYLRTLAGKLAHEIRTPLTIVRSSLENLESEGSYPARGARVPGSGPAGQRAPERHPGRDGRGHARRRGDPERRAHAVRPRAGDRLGGRGLPHRLPAARSSLRAPARGAASSIDGAPDLIVQMLDKLIDNAVDFSPPGATITVRLRLEPDAARARSGEPRPAAAARGARPAVRVAVAVARRRATAARISASASTSCRLIAEFHGGHADADGSAGWRPARASRCGSKCDCRQQTT